MYSNCFPTVSWSLKPWNGLLAWVAYSYPLISEKFVTEMSASKLRLPGYLVWKGPASGPFWFIPSSFWGLAKAKRKKVSLSVLMVFKVPFLKSMEQFFSMQLIYFCEQNMISKWIFVWIYPQHLSFFCFWGWHTKHTWKLEIARRNGTWLEATCDGRWTWKPPNGGLV